MKRNEVPDLVAKANKAKKLKSSIDSLYSILSYYQCNQTPLELKYNETVVEIPRSGAVDDVVNTLLKEVLSCYEKKLEEL